MDNFGELVRGLFEMFGDRTTEATAETPIAATEDPGADADGTGYVRVLVGRSRALNINDR